MVYNINELQRRGQHHRLWILQRDRIGENYQIPCHDYYLGVGP